MGPNKFWGPYLVPHCLGMGAWLTSRNMLLTMHITTSNLVVWAYVGDPKRFWGRWAPTLSDEYVET